MSINFVVNLSYKVWEQIIEKLLLSRGFNNISSWENTYDILVENGWNISITSNVVIKKDNLKINIWDIPNVNNIPQIVNHYPNPYALTQKFNLTKNLRNNVKDYKKFYPTTYLLKINEISTEIEDFLQNFNSKNNMWIVKPSNLRRGEEIKIYDNLEDIYEFINTNQSSFSKVQEYVIQKYIPNPLLYDGRKFDVRIHVLLDENYNIYINDLIIMRITSEKYNPKLTGVWEKDKYIHITNIAIQKNSKNFSKYEKSNVKSMFNVKIKGVNLFKKFLPIWSSIIKKILLSCKNELLNNMKTQKNRSFYELLGFDFIIDNNMHTWLLEVNMNPTLYWNNKEIDSNVNVLLNDMFKIVLDPFFNIKSKDDNINSWMVL